MCFPSACLSPGLHTPWGCGFHTQTHTHTQPSHSQAQSVTTSKIILYSEVVFIWGLMFKRRGLWCATGLNVSFNFGFLSFNLTLNYFRKKQNVKCIWQSDLILYLNFIMLHFFVSPFKVIDPVTCFSRNLMFLKLHSVVWGKNFKTDFFMLKQTK